MRLQEEILSQIDLNVMEDIAIQQSLTGIRDAELIQLIAFFKFEALRPSSPSMRLDQLKKLFINLMLHSYMNNKGMLFEEDEEHNLFVYDDIVAEANTLTAYDVAVIMSTLSDNILTKKFDAIDCRDLILYACALCDVPVDNILDLLVEDMDDESNN